MAYYLTQLILHRTTGLPEDDSVMTLHTASDEGAAGVPATASAINGYIAAAFYDAVDGGGNRLSRFLSTEVSRVNLPTLKTYDNQFPGSPLAVDTMVALGAPLTAGPVSSYPAEVAVCLSFRADYGSLLEQAGDDADPDAAPERPRSRVRGRVFFGPCDLACGDGAPSRPTSIVTPLLDFANRMKDINTAPRNGADVFWAVHSKEAGGVSLPVTTAWVDNAWDIQRRRGVAPTARTTVVL